MTASELWRRGQEGWPRSFPIVQFPNLPLMLALAGQGCAALSDGTTREVGRGLFHLGIAVWALEEVAAGDNWLRRLLGAGALIRTVSVLAK